MNKIQYIELLKLRGITELKGESIAGAVKRTGGDPTESEMVKVNEAAMRYYIGKFQEANENIDELEGTIKHLRNKLEEAEQDVEMLNALKEVGVDNWSGYPMAMDLLNEVDDDGPAMYSERDAVRFRGDGDDD